MVTLHSSFQRERRACQDIQRRVIQRKNRVERVKSSQIKRARTPLRSSVLLLCYGTQYQHKIQYNQRKIKVNEDGGLFPQPKGQQQQFNSLCIPLCVLYHCVWSRSYQLVLLQPIRIRRYVIPCCVAFSLLPLQVQSCICTDDGQTFINQARLDPLGTQIKALCYATKYIPALRNQVYYADEYRVT